MSDSISDLARSIAHSLTSGSKDERETRSVTLSREFSVPVAELWSAITTADRIGKWMTAVSGDLRLGGRYQLEGNAGGSVTACEPERSFEITWEYAGAVGWVSVAVEEVTDSRSRLTLTHTDHVYEEFWNQYGPGGTGVGWDLSFLGLARHVERGEQQPPETEGWESSPEGVAFVTACSNDWADVSIQWGSQEVEARRVAANTTAFYTGALQDAWGHTSEGDTE